MNPTKCGRDERTERTDDHWTVKKDECRGNGLVEAKKIHSIVRVEQWHGRKRAHLNS